MRVLIQRENSVRAEAVLLAASKYDMRAALQGAVDTEHWKQVDGVWRDEDGGRIEIDALIAVDETDWMNFCSDIAVPALAATHSFS